MKNVTYVFTSRFNHPLLAGLLAASAMLFLVGGIAQFAPREAVTGVVPAFLGIYGILSGTLGMSGYLILYVVRYVSELRDEDAPTAS